jgi:hypothetical protein
MEYPGPNSSMKTLRQREVFKKTSKPAAKTFMMAWSSLNYKN